MREQNIIYISLSIVILGIISLFIISYFLDYKETEIGKIDGSYLGKNVKIVGEVSKYKDYSTVKTFLITDSTGENRASIAITPISFVFLSSATE